MIKKFGKALPYALAGAIAMNTFTGCGISKTVEQPAIVQEYSLEDLDIAEKVETEVLQPKVDEKRTLELVDDISIDLDEFEDIKYDEDQTSMKHIRKLYNYVRKYPINIDSLLEELENILMAKQVSLSEFDYYKNTLFNHLSWIYPEEEGLVDFYYPLAKYMHEQYCTLEVTSEDGIFYCPSIDERIDRINETTLLNGVLVEEVNASDDEELKSELNRILRSNRYDECLTELDNLYILSIIPQDLDEEEYKELFGSLSETVGPRDNIFEIYYNLAFYRHLMKCDEEHTLNEYGKYECESVRKLYRGH